MTAVTFHPSGRYLLSSSLDATLKVWDLRMGYALYTLYGHEGATTAVNFSPDGDYLCSGGADSVVMVWLSNLDYSNNAPIPTTGGDLNIKGNKKLVPEMSSMPGAPSGISNIKTYEEQKGIIRQEIPGAKLPAGSSAVKRGVVVGSSSGEGSEELAGRLDKVVSQLNIITKTLNILEQRMRVTEGQVSKLMDKHMEKHIGGDRIEQREEESATFKVFEGKQES